MQGNKKYLKKSDDRVYEEDMETFHSITLCFLKCPEKC